MNLAVVFQESLLGFSISLQSAEFSSSLRSSADVVEKSIARFFGFDSARRPLAYYCHSAGPASMGKHKSLVSKHQNLHNSEADNGNLDRGKDTSLEHSTRTPAEEEWEYVTGYKLIVVMGACTMADFLTSLDTSIFATVSPEFTSLAVIPSPADF